MYVSRVDMDIVRSDEVRAMKKQYREKFGKPFPPFNYDDFPGTKTLLGAEMYRGLLEKSLREGKPHDKDSYWPDLLNGRFELP